MESDSSSKDESISGFQKPLRYLKCLPYASLVEVEADAALVELKINLAKAVASQDFYVNLPYWMTRTSVYIAHYGYRFSKEDHIALVKLAFRIFVQKEIDTGILLEAGQLLSVLLKRDYLLDRSDLELPWRPLFEVNDYFQNSGELKNGFLRLPSRRYWCPKYRRRLPKPLAQRRDWEAVMSDVLNKCRKYFPVSAVEEIWIEVRPRLCLSNNMKQDHALDGLNLLNNFVPMFTTLHSEISRVFLPYIFDLWHKYCNHTKYEKILLSLIQRCAISFIGVVDMRPHLDRLFNSLLRNLGLPVGSHGAVNTQSHMEGQPDISIYVTIIVFSVIPGPQGEEILSRVTQLFSALASFFHPSNRGAWSNRVGGLLKSFAKNVYFRVSRERHLKPRLECFGNTPAEFHITDDHVTALVNILLPPCMQSVIRRPRTADALRHLALLRPALVMPKMLEQVENAHETSLDPQRLTNVVQVLGYMHLPLLESAYSDYPEGRLQVLPLLRSLLPAIDINNPTKFYHVMNCIGNMVSCIRVEDISSKAGDPGLSEKEKELAMATAHFEDIVLQMFDGILSGLANLSSNTELQQDSHRKATKTMQENSLLTQLYTVSMKLCLSMTIDLRRQVLKKLVDFTFENILDAGAGRELRYLLTGIIQDDLKETALGLFLPRFTDVLNELMRDNHVIYNGEPDSQLLWLLSALAGLATYRLISYQKEWLHILGSLWPLYNTKLTKCVAHDLLKCTVVNLTADSLKMDASILYPPDFHLKDWTALRKFSDYATDEPAWIIRGPEHFDFAQKLVDVILDPMIIRLSEYPTKSDSFAQRELQCISTWISSFLEGGYTCMPRSPSDEVITVDCGTDIPIVETKCGPLVVNCSGKRYELTCQDGKNIRETVLDIGVLILEKANEKSAELDSDTFQALTKMCRLACLQETLATDDSKSLRTWAEHFTTLYGNTLRKGQFGVVTWVLRAQGLHTYRFCMPRLAVTAKVLRFAKALYPFVVSQYALQRKEAISALSILCQGFTYLAYPLVDAILPYLDIHNSSIKEHQFQGALECFDVLCAAADIRRSLYLLSKVYPAICVSGISEHCNKPAIRNSQQNIVDNLTDKGCTMTLNMFECNKDLQKLADHLGDGCVDLVKCRTETQKTISKYLDSRRDFYQKIIDSMLAPFNGQIVGSVEPDITNIPWEPLNRMMELLPLQCQVPIPSSVFKFVIGNIFHVVPAVSSTATYNLLAALWTLRYRRRRIMKPPPTYVKEPQPGIRADNAFLQYDPSLNLLEDEEAWQKHHRIVQVHVGFRWWPELIRTRDPSDVPPFIEDSSPLTPTHLTNSVDRENWAYVTDFLLKEETWTQLEKYLLSVYVDKNADMSVGSSDGQSSDEFNEEKFPLGLLMSTIFRTLGLRCVKHAERLILRLFNETSNKKEYLQKCGMVALAGMIAGSKDWPREMTRRLLCDVVPPLITKFLDLAPYHLRDTFNDELITLVAEKNYDYQLMTPIVKHMTSLMKQWRLQYAKEAMCYYFQLMFTVGCGWRGASLYKQVMNEWPLYGQHDNIKLRRAASISLQVIITGDLTTVGADPELAQFCSYKFLAETVLPLVAHHVCVVLKTKEIEPSAITVKLAQIFAETQNNTDKMSEAVGTCFEAADDDDAPEEGEDTPPMEEDGQAISAASNDQWKARIRSMSILTSVLNGMASAIVHYAFSYPRTPIWDLLLVSSDLFACRSREHLEHTLANCFLAYSNMQVTTQNLEDVLRVLLSISHHASWKARKLCLSLTQQLVFNNLYTFNSPQVPNKIRDIIFRLLLDDILEVRNEAAVTLAGLVQCGYLATDSSITGQLYQWSRLSRPKKKTVQSTLSPEESTRLLQRHSGVLGLCALIKAFPHQVPTFLPDVLMEVCSHAQEPEPMRATVKETLASFSKTHQETWYLHKEQFTDDQLAVLTDMLVSPSYYA